MDKVIFLTLEQFGILFFFIIVGYLLSKFGILKEVKPLSTALMWVFMPAVVFNVFSKNFTISNFSKAMPYVLAGIVMLLITAGVSHLLVKRYKDRITRNTFWYSMIISNMSYVGIPIVENIFPELSLFFMVYMTGYNVFVFGIGISLFNPEPQKFSFKGLLSPIMIAMVLGMVCGLVFDALSITMPSVVSSIVGSAAGCMSPVAMVITGVTLARLPLKSVFVRADVYVFTFFRLILYPLVFGGLLYLLHIWLGLPIGIVKVAIIFLSLPMGINTVVFAEANGADGTVGAQGAFISHLFSIATLPLIMAVVSIL